MIEAFFGAVKDGFALAVIGLGFVACVIHDALFYFWRMSVPDDKATKGDEQHAASIEHFPFTYMTFLIALIGAIGCGLIVAWGL